MESEPFVWSSWNHRIMTGKDLQDHRVWLGLSSTVSAKVWREPLSGRALESKSFQNFTRWSVTVFHPGELLLLKEQARVWKCRRFFSIILKVPSLWNHSSQMRHERTSYTLHPFSSCTSTQIPPSAEFAVSHNREERGECHLIDYTAWINSFVSLANILLSSIFFHQF